MAEKRSTSPSDLETSDCDCERGIQPGPSKKRKIKYKTKFSKKNGQRPGPSLLGYLEISTPFRVQCALGKCHVSTREYVMRKIT